MKLFNSQTGKIEEIRAEDGEVAIYVCGITPHDTTHLGHAFTYCTADILIRYLESNGLTVRYAQNVNDIDDDILKKAEMNNENWRALGDRWTRHFIADMQTLNVRPPDYLLKATDVMAEIIESVRALLAAGVAYEVAGNVYFEVDAWSKFGHLSQIPRAAMLRLANERGNYPDDPNKRDPLDFVLWQAQQEGEPSWPSPWGEGRPGWHIECSTAITMILGSSIDIHVGGADLLFPHHECEAARVEAVYEAKPFVRHWLHTAMVEHEGEKMAKSLGNLIMVRDLLQRYSPDTIRIYLAQRHYRTPWEHDELALRKAARHAEKLKAAMMAIGTGDKSLNARPAQQRFAVAMENDLDTVKGIATLLNLADEILFRASNGYSIGDAQESLRHMSSIFGLSLDEEEAVEDVIEGWNAHLRRFSNQTSLVK